MALHPTPPEAETEQVRTPKRSVSIDAGNHDRRVCAPEHAEGQAAALVVVVDDVERIEAHHGPTGLTEVLRFSGQRIRQTLRTDDFTARWGAEELVVILRNVSIDAAVEVGQRIRMAISQPITLQNGQSLVATCAIGAAAGDPDGIDALIERAHLAYALAKHSGGNCVRRALPVADRWTAGALTS